MTEPSPKHNDDDDKSQIAWSAQKTKAGRRYIILAELHADLFSRHASPLEVYFLCAISKGAYDWTDP